jgi:hypothetical protein
VSSLRVLTGNRMTGHKSNTDMTEELEITDISAITRTYQMKRLQNVRRMSRNPYPKTVLSVQTEEKKHPGTPNKHRKFQFLPFRP